MLDIEKLDDEVFNALQSRGWSLDAIQKMDPEKAFDEFCMWNGLIGCGQTLRRALDTTRAAVVPPTSTPTDDGGPFQSKTFAELNAGRESVRGYAPDADNATEKGLLCKGWQDGNEFIP